MTFDDAKPEIDKYMDEWVRLLLPGWCVTAELREGDPGHSAESITRWEYMQAHVIFYPDTFDEVTNPNIESLVVHELVHAMLDQLGIKPSKNEERVVTMIETALMRVKGAGK